MPPPPPPPEKLATSAPEEKNGNGNQQRRIPHLSNLHLWQRSPSAASGGSTVSPDPDSSPDTTANTSTADINSSSNNNNNNNNSIGNSISNTTTPSVLLPQNIPSTAKLQPKQHVSYHHSEHTDHSHLGVPKANSTHNHFSVSAIAAATSSSSSSTSPFASLAHPTHDHDEEHLFHNAQEFPEDDSTRDHDNVGPAPKNASVALETAGGDAADEDLPVSFQVKPTSSSGMPIAPLMPISPITSNSVASRHLVIGKSRGQVRSSKGKEKATEDHRQYHPLQNELKASDSSSNLSRSKEALTQDASEPAPILTKEMQRRLRSQLKSPPRTYHKHPKGRYEHLEPFKSLSNQDVSDIQKISNRFSESLSRYWWLCSLPASSKLEWKDVCNLNNGVTATPLKIQPHSKLAMLFDSADDRVDKALFDLTLSFLLAKLAEYVKKVSGGPSTTYFLTMADVWLVRSFERHVKVFYKMKFKKNRKSAAAEKASVRLKTPHAFTPASTPRPHGVSSLGGVGGSHGTGHGHAHSHGNGHGHFPLPPALSHLRHQELSSIPSQEALHQRAAYAGNGGSGGGSTTPTTTSIKAKQDGHTLTWKQREAPIPPELMRYLNSFLEEFWRYIVCEFQVLSANDVQEIVDELNALLNLYYLPARRVEDDAENSDNNWSNDEEELNGVGSGAKSGAGGGQHGSSSKQGQGGTHRRGGNASTIGRRAPVQININGVRLLGNQSIAAVHMFMGPAIVNIVKFLTGIELPKFFKGFLVMFNDMVTIYYKYMQRKVSLLKLVHKRLKREFDDPFRVKTKNSFFFRTGSSDTDSSQSGDEMDEEDYMALQADIRGVMALDQPSSLPSSRRGSIAPTNSHQEAGECPWRSLYRNLDDEEADGIDLLLYSELQRMHEIHVSIAMTDNPLETRKETLYITSCARKFKRFLFPFGMVTPFLDALDPSRLLGGMENPLARIRSFSSVPTLSQLLQATISPWGNVMAPHKAAAASAAAAANGTKGVDPLHAGGSDQLSPLTGLHGHGTGPSGGGATPGGSSSSPFPSSSTSTAFSNLTDELKNLAGLLEPHIDVQLLYQTADRLRDYINILTAPDSLNTMILDFVRAKFPHIYAKAVGVGANIDAAAAVVTRGAAAPGIGAGLGVASGGPQVQGAQAQGAKETQGTQGTQGMQGTSATPTPTALPSRTTISDIFSKGFQVKPPTLQEIEASLLRRAQARNCVAEMARELVEHSHDKEWWQSLMQTRDDDGGGTGGSADGGGDGNGSSEAGASASPEGNGTDSDYDSPPRGQTKTSSSSSSTKSDLWGQPKKMWRWFGKRWRSVIGYNDLVVSAILQLFDLMQKQVFVKSLVYRTLDFVINEMEGSLFRGVHREIAEGLWIRHNRKRKWKRRLNRRQPRPAFASSPSQSALPVELPANYDDEDILALPDNYFFPEPAPGTNLFHDRKKRGYVFGDENDSYADGVLFDEYEDEAPHFSRGGSPTGGIGIGAGGNGASTIGVNATIVNGPTGRRKSLSVLGIGNGGGSGTGTSTPSDLVSADTLQAPHVFAHANRAGGRSGSSLPLPEHPKPSSMNGDTDFRHHTGRSYSTPGVGNASGASSSLSGAASGSGSGSGTAAGQNVAVETQQKYEDFKTLFDYMRGGFATDLAKNLVSLINFHEEHKVLLSGSASNASRRLQQQRQQQQQQQHATSLGGYSIHAGVSLSTIDGTGQRAPVANPLSSMATFSSQLGMKFLELSSSVQGISDMVGQFLLASVEDMLGTSYSRIATVEEFLSSVLRSAREKLRKEREACETVSLLFDQIVVADVEMIAKARVKRKHRLKRVAQRAAQVAQRRVSELARPSASVGVTPRPMPHDPEQQAVTGHPSSRRHSGRGRDVDNPDDDEDDDDDDDDDEDDEQDEEDDEEELSKGKTSPTLADMHAQSRSTEDFFVNTSRPTAPEDKQKKQDHHHHRHQQQHRSQRKTLKHLDKWWEDLLREIDDEDEGRRLDAIFAQLLGEPIHDDDVCEGNSGSTSSTPSTLHSRYVAPLFATSLALLHPTLPVSTVPKPYTPSPTDTRHPDASVNKVPSSERSEGDSQKRRDILPRIAQPKDEKDGLLALLSIIKQSKVRTFLLHLIQSAEGDTGMEDNPAVQQLWWRLKNRMTAFRRKRRLLSKLYLWK